MHGWNTEKHLQNLSAEHLLDSTLVMNYVPALNDGDTVANDNTTCIDGSDPMSMQLCLLSLNCFKRKPEVKCSAKR